jgi:hypothetical protein
MRTKRQAKKMEEWMITGICPACGDRSVTGGRCIMCGWEGIQYQLRVAERKVEDIKDLLAINAIFRSLGLL